jgi:hypothetical protein
MQLPVLIEPLATGGFIARAGEPFAGTAEGATAEEAVLRLEGLLRARLQAGSRVAVISLPNGLAGPHSEPENEDSDWAFRIMQETIEENRRRENEADQ